MRIKALIIVIVSLLSSNVAIAASNDLYLKASLGAAALRYHKTANPMEGILNGTATHKSIIVLGNLGLAGGYYLSDTSRAEAELKVYSIGKLESTFNSLYSKTFHVVTKKPQIITMMLGGYADLFNVGSAKFFVGGKVGMAQVNEKISSTTHYPDWGDKIGFDYKNKPSNNFAIGLVTGVNFPLSDKVKADISLSYNDFGKSKSLKRSGTEYGKTPYKSLNLEAGFRFDL